MKIHIPKCNYSVQQQSLIHKGLLHLPIGITHLALLMREKQSEQKDSFWSEQMQTIQRRLLQREM